MQAATHTSIDAPVHPATHDEGGFWTKYIFSTDHKIIGLQYGMTSLVSCFSGSC